MSVDRGKKGGKRTLERRRDIVFWLNEGYRVCVRSTTKWVSRAKNAKRLGGCTGTFCGVTKPILLTTTTTQTRQRSVRIADKVAVVYPVERGNPILRRHPYYLPLARDDGFAVAADSEPATHRRKRE